METGSREWKERVLQATNAARERQAQRHRETCERLRSQTTRAEGVRTRTRLLREIAELDYFWDGPGSEGRCA